MERFVIRNYGPSRNLPDGHGSYIFLERDGVQGTSDPELAELMATYPQIVVSERGQDLIGVVPAPPAGPPPPEELPDQGEDEDDQGENEDDQGEGEDDQGESQEVDYSALLVADLQEIAEERHIATTGLKKAQLIEALLQNDAEGKEVSPPAELTIDQRVRCGDEEEEYVISAVPEVAGEEFTIQNTGGEEFSVGADQLTLVEDEAAE